jgi:hypothetical protein
LARTRLSEKMTIITKEEEKYNQLWPDICPLCERMME